ncbi:MAG: hypothetical protein G3M78_03485 [Candidatus Nitrohelix vancouverensis]|uniref:Prepilin-type N-terminal cleavage/methylation domain-containing protein n=1 Tax=Candidatus Nitrohelix vancouverensis TaxID=2705534 RepID=A0A7T0C0X7_9BACT|nr:MAG: hypothetical protein G3M78_03485 [Candidatus Nitrohelix vancouverensis]
MNRNRVKRQGQKAGLKTRWREESGLTLVEFMVAAIIGVILLGATIYVFTMQEEVIQDENSSTNIRAKGRHAIKIITRELKMAGFGMPPDQGITAMSSSSISYRVNNGDVRTTTPTGSSGVSAGAAGATDLTVVDGTGFADGDKIVIYNPGAGSYELNTVDGTPTASNLPLGSGLANSYTYGLNTRLFTVNKYNDVTLQHSGTNITKTVDSGSADVLISEAQSMSFDFYGETETSQVKRIGVSISMQDTNDSKLTKEFKTDVVLRN